jgi:hypothetical protein
VTDERSGLALQSGRDASGNTYGHESKIPGIQRAAASLLWAAVEHAQLGPLQWAYGLSNLVLIDRIPSQDRPLAERMLDGEIDRQKRLKAEITKDPQTATWLEEKHLFQNYKQLQFFDTLAL